MHLCGVCTSVWSSPVGQKLSTCHFLVDELGHEHVRNPCHIPLLTQQSCWNRLAFLRQALGQTRQGCVSEKPIGVRAPPRSLSMLTLLLAQGAELAPGTATGEARVLRRADLIGPRPESHCSPQVEGMRLATLQPAPSMRREVASEARCGCPGPGGQADSARVGRHLCGAQFPLLPDPGSSGFHLKTLFGVESGTVDKGAEPQAKTGSRWSRSGEVGVAVVS